MLETLIPYIDESITGFEQNLGLAEMIRESGEEGKRFPAIRDTENDYSQIDLEQRVCYHRQSGEIRFEQKPDENLVGCSDVVEITYPMLLVGCRQGEKFTNAYTPEKIASQIAGRLAAVKVEKAIKNIIKVFSVEVYIKSINTDRYSVWDGEYANIPMSAEFKHMYFSIGYDIKVKADSACLNSSC